MYTAIVVRPGETDFDREERIQGALDLPLTAEGRRQVQSLIERLRDVRPDVLYTSPSQPARATAEIISAALDVPLKELEGLANMDQGLWQGMLVSDLRRKHPRVFRQWQESPETVCPPAGETCSAVVARVEQALRKPMKKTGTFAVVVSEPLASIVSSLLRGDETPRLTGLPVGGAAPGTLEVVDASAGHETSLAAHHATETAPQLR